MIVFTGKYSWDGKKHNDEEPIAWFPGAYNLKIFHIATEGITVKHLKPYLCIYSKTGKGHSISANPEKFAKQICNKFSLEIEKVLWAEELQNNSGDFDVVVFTETGQLGESFFYKIDKRKPMVGERKLIDQELACISNETQCF